MELESLKKHFYRVIAPSLPNEWEVEDVLAGLLELPKEDIELYFDEDYNEFKSNDLWDKIMSI